MAERASKDRSQFSAALDNIRGKRDDVSRKVSEAAAAFSTLGDPTPGDIKDYWQERLALLATRVHGLHLDVPACDRSHDQIQELRAQNRTLVVNLPELTLEVLGRMHPNLAGHWSVRRSNGIESVMHYGYLDVENVTGSPNLRSNEDDLRRIAEETGRYGMTLPTYYIGSNEHFDRTGEHYDHGYKTISRLPGSRNEGDVLNANFYSVGRPNVHSFLLPGRRHPGLGGRFEGVMK